MKIAILCMLCSTVPLLATSGPKSLSNRLMDVTIEYIRTSGPDEDAAQFIDVTSGPTCERREELAQVTLPYLTNPAPDKVAAALAVLSRLRWCRPEVEAEDGAFAVEKVKCGPQSFWNGLDEKILANVDYFHSIGTKTIFKNLALYLGCVPSEPAKRELLRIAAQKDGKEQALICIAFHRDPKDIHDLMPFMLEESETAWALPYHFRNSYGRAAIPYLLQALTNAQSRMTRQQSAYELVHLGIPDGFHYLERVALANPEPEERTRPRALDGIRQFAVDYLGLPRNVKTPTAITAQIAKKEQELCASQNLEEGMSNQTSQTVGGGQNRPKH